MTARLVAAALAFAASGAAAAEEWRFSVTPYLWTTDIGLDVAVHDRTLVDGTIPFEELVEDLHSAFILRADAMRGEHGVVIDLFDVTLAGNGDIDLPNGSGGSLEFDSDIAMTILDLTAVYDPDGDGRGLALLYGTRLIGRREDVAVSSQGSPQGGGSARHEADDLTVDGLVGLRWAGGLPGGWRYEIAADASTGGTRLTWSLAPSLGYAFGARQQYRLTAGYRFLDIDFDTDPALEMGMTMSGFLAGFRYQF